MPNEPPKSRPEAPAPKPKRSASGGDESVYGSQWGQSGKQNPDDAQQADPRSPTPPGGGAKTPRRPH